MTGPVTNPQSSTEPFWYPEADREQAARNVAKAFGHLHGRPPAGVWAAPGRVNLIGEHVDYNGGLCLPFALEHRTFVALSPRTDGRVRIRSGQVPGQVGGQVPGNGEGPADWEGDLEDVAPGTVDGWAGYAVGVPWALREAGFDVPGFDAVVDGHVPLGSGLSSSAALECAVAIALDDVAGLGLGGDDAGRTRLAAACVRAENDIAGAPTGGMDQATSLRARPGAALLLDCLDSTVEPVPFDLLAHGLELLVIDTRAHHSLVDGQYGSRREACAQAAALLGVTWLRELALDGLDDVLRRIDAAVDDPEQADEMQRRVRHVVTEIARVTEVADLLRQGRVRDIGPLLDASHASLRDDYEVSAPELDQAVTAAVEAGALGARMTGGGFGGSAIALVGRQDSERVAAAVAAAFERRGFDPPAFLRAIPSSAAAREV